MLYTPPFTASRVLLSIEYSFIWFLSQNVWDITHIVLCLVQIICSSVVNVVAESSSNHGKGLKVRVVLLQLARLDKRSWSCHLYYSLGKFLKFFLLLFLQGQCTLINVLEKVLYKHYVQTTIFPMWKRFKKLPWGERTLFGQRWNRASSCDRWCHGNPCERCTSTLSEPGKKGKNN